jgi:hypothetical protein
LENVLGISFLCENWTVWFGKPGVLVFPENSYIHSFNLILLLYPSYLVSKCLLSFISLHLPRSNMVDDDERRVKARHDVTQYYQRRGVKRTTSRQDMSRGDLTISCDPDPNANNSSDDDVEDEAYVPLPRAHPHGKGLVGPSGSGSRAARDEEIE